MDQGGDARLEDGHPAGREGPAHQGPVPGVARRIEVEDRVLGDDPALPVAEQDPEARAEVSGVLADRLDLALAGDHPAAFGLLPVDRVGQAQPGQGGVRIPPEEGRVADRDVELAHGVGWPAP